MIVDCHTYIWESDEQLGRALLSPRTGSGDSDDGGGVSASPREHLRASHDVDASLVLGFTSRLLNAEVPNTYVAEYVNAHPDKMIGFAGVDATDENVADHIEEARDLGMKGLTLSPASQNFHPADTRAMRVYEKAPRYGMPVFVQEGIHFPAGGHLEFANPIHFDEPAREFSDLKIVIAHMGYPWIDQTLCLVGKHANVFADISGIVTMTWRAYTSLLTAYEYRVIDRLLFGSNFPFTSPTDSIKTLYRVNQIAHDASLPTIPRELLRGIIERDTLTLLGLRPVSNNGSSAGANADDD